LITFEFSKYVNRPAKCKVIRVHLRHESPDQREQFHIDFSYKVWFDFSHYRKCTADIQKYYFATLNYEFFQVDECSLRLHRVMENQVKNRDYLCSILDDILELFMNQLIYVQFF
jgi:hypothetical protein